MTSGETPDNPVTPPAGGPTLGLAEAAKACGVSPSTIRRRRAELAEYGARQDRPGGGWSIPIAALVRIGLMDAATAPDTPPAQAVAPVTAPPADSPLKAEITRLEKALTEQRHRADLAEAIAAERLAALEVERMALRALTAAPTPPVADPDPPAGEHADADPGPRRRWWRRH